MLGNVIDISSSTDINSYTAAIALSQNSSTLKAAIIKVIKACVSKNIASFESNKTLIQANEIVNNLTITLPQSISLKDDLSGKITEVQLSYCGVEFSSYFTISGFKTVSSNNVGSTSIPVNKINSTNPKSNNSTSNHDINVQIASFLSSMLSDNNLNIQDYDGLYNTTAADSLNNPLTLKEAIISLIQNEFINSGITPLFNFDGITYTITEITNNITINLPYAISLQDDIDGQISGIEFAYNGITLTNSSNQNVSNTFTINGFKTTTAAAIGDSPTPENDTVNPSINASPNPNAPISVNRNTYIVNLLDSLLNSTINVANYESMSSYSAQNALNNYQSNLETAIISAIEDEIGNSSSPFIYGSSIICGGVAYTASLIASGIKVILPINVSKQDNETSQISGVLLSYNGYLLT
ncbi:hypothetical protein IKS57_03550 [bacterium]|nr:hypothetical protein [bacterium]